MTAFGICWMPIFGYSSPIGDDLGSSHRSSLYLCTAKSRKWHQRPTARLATQSNKNLSSLRITTDIVEKCVHMRSEQSAAKNTSSRISFPHAAANQSGLDGVRLKIGAVWT
jgi:hypothetical protein